MIPSEVPVGAEAPVVIGRLRIHPERFDGAVERILAQVDAGNGGYVVTPNVHHICVAETDPEFRNASLGAFLALPDGRPLLWMARLMRTPIPEKVSGSDLIVPLLRLAGRRGFSVYLLGADDATCASAVRVLQQNCPGLEIAGWASPNFDPSGDATEIEDALDKLALCRPDLLLVAMSCPKQEYLMARYRDWYAPTVAIGVGAGLDFLAGTVRRAPAWVSGLGFEWLYRLQQEPARLWRRYLVEDRAIAGIFWRSLRATRPAPIARSG